MHMIKSSPGRLTVAGLAAVLLAACLVWWQAGPAQAAYTDCPEKTFCLYTQAGGAGEMVSLAPQDGPVLDYGTVATLKDRTFLSFRNNTASWTCLYDDPAYGGTDIQAVLPGHTGGDLAKGADGLPKVTVASHKFAPSKSLCRTGFDRCDAGRVCIFQGPSGRGVGGVTSQTEVLPDGVLGNRDYGVAWDDKLVSVANRSHKTACFYRDPGYSGTWQTGGVAYRAFVVLPGEETTLPADYRSSVSSHKLADAEGKC
ncbi:peptidase inhibitor family I36 protein [Streptomyces hydrogenans]|uniref:peptidase inhibitor family I36 protein n=1 Tax=Streptomyces TaxID=1883 RepID=UPI00202EA490|nr:peptidase inhibitor family I36 protein [Streptomyces sp. G2]MCM1945819.1 peptidase inhibitor family I36 protein [Streptomyces sp. G2]